MHQQLITRIPFKKGLPIFGSGISFLKKPLGLLTTLCEEYPVIVKVRIPGKTYHVVNGAELSQWILQKNAKNYYKPGEAKELKKLLGEGLSTSNGEYWWRQRKLIQPAFHNEKMAGFIPIIDSASDQLLKKWNEPGNYNIGKAFQQVTLDIITQTMFGIDISNHLASVSQIIDEMMSASIKRVSTLIKIPKFIPTPANIRFLASNRKFEEFIYTMIKEREQEILKSPQMKRDDLLGMLLQASYEGLQYKMTYQQIRDEIVTIFMAGHETTSQTLSWMFYQLAVNPQILHLAQKEADSIGPTPPTMDNLANLPIIQSVIEETLRMYPPLWVLARKAHQEDCGYLNICIPKDATMLINIYGMHRSPIYWEEPNTFLPERFRLASPPDQPSFAYLPFGGGPRLCIGNRFAMMILKIVGYKLLQAFNFQVPASHKPIPVPRSTLRSNSPIRLVITPRK